MFGHQVKLIMVEKTPASAAPSPTNTICCTRTRFTSMPICLALSGLSPTDLHLRAEPVAVVEEREKTTKAIAQKICTGMPQTELGEDL